MFHTLKPYLLNLHFHKMIKRHLPKILLFLFLLDVVYSFVQHYETFLDGDMANIVMPSPAYEKVLKDPFGVNVVLKGEMYPGPNRYFAHAGMSAYFKSAPFFFQLFDTPINSIYWACALIKIIIQVGIILLIAAYISEKKIWNLEFLFAVVLITPLFQTSGYNAYMGVIDRSISYNFFYSLPLGLLLLYFLPFYKSREKNYKSFSVFENMLFALFTIVLSFNGPLVQAVVLIICPSYLLYTWYQEYQKNTQTSFLERSWISISKIPKQILFSFLFFCLLSLYSIYIGFNNSENLTNMLPLLERYQRLPLGLYNMLTQKIGFALFYFMFIVNFVFVTRVKGIAERKYLLYLFRWMLVFSCIYILLLPFGGFRNYRPNIVRYDTFMPILFCMMILYGKTTFFLIRTIDIKYKKIYLGAIAIFSGIMTFADKPIINHNSCEKQALNTIANSNEKIVLVDSTCKVMSWENIKDYRMSETNGRLLNYWRITKEQKYYYQP